MPKNNRKMVAATVQKLKISPASAGVLLTIYDAIEAAYRESIEELKQENKRLLKDLERARCRP